MAHQDYSVEDFAHYFIVYGVLLISWVPLMNYFGSNITATALAGVVVFIIADKLAHKLILGE